MPARSNKPARRLRVEPAPAAQAVAGQPAVAVQPELPVVLLEDSGALVGLVIAHVYFAVRPEKWWITKSMILGFITRRQYLEHHEPSRWPVAKGSSTKHAGQA